MNNGLQTPATALLGLPELVGKRRRMYRSITTDIVARCLNSWTAAGQHNCLHYKLRSVILPCAVPVLTFGSNTCRVPWMGTSGWWNKWE